MTDAPKPLKAAAEPFWRQRALHELTKREWESLCDGCGRCCLVKLEDEDTGAIYFTDVGCRLFDPQSARCADYGHRSRRVHDCIKLDPQAAGSLSWLPPTCAYRLLAHGEDLPAWHPLITGRAESVVEAGVSVRGKVLALEDQLEPEDMLDHIVSWPAKTPKLARNFGKTAKSGGKKKRDAAPD